jgi:hypothetical protein
MPYVGRLELYFPPSTIRICVNRLWRGLFQRAALASLRLMAQWIMATAVSGSLS